MSDPARCDQSCRSGPCRAGMDLSRFPVVLIHSESRVTDALFDERMAALDDLLARRQPYACLVLIGPDSASSRDHRRRVNQWYDDHAEAIRGVCGGVGLVFLEKQSTLRTVLGSMLLRMGRPVPHRMFSDVDEAVRWAQEQVEALAWRR